jgi:mono/diheme cytochrome c family protein
MRRAALLLGGLGLVLLLAAGRVAFEFRDEPAAPPAAAEPVTPELLARGEALTRAGNCMACHTARGGLPYAGGRGIATPFGTVYASNLTPDTETGLGAWSAAEFWRALHHGRSRDGRLLYPAFPYINTTLATRADSDAVFAHLRSLPPVRQANTPHALRFPYGTQWALAAWRSLFFRAGEYESNPAQSAEWNRGAYLVQGLAHCNACHASRNALGATASPLDLNGGLIPMQNWYAPALTSPAQAGVADWALDDIVALLKNGVSQRGSALGPMAEVVGRSTQYLPVDDLRAMAVYLQSLPQTVPAHSTLVKSANGSVLERGARLYAKHCAACHGDGGEGVRGAYPALAGNRLVGMDPPANLVRIVLGGGYPPSTAGNPRPYGMPPFATVLADDDVAALLSYLRSSWGHRASAVTSVDVNRYRSGVH